MVPAHRRHAFAAYALAALLTTTGIDHFVSPRGFEGIVPAFLGSAAFWVAVSGVAELACAVLLVPPRTRVLAGWACLALFVVVYPANITMVVHAEQGHGSVLIAWLRLPLQIPLVIWALYIARNGAPLLSPARLRRPVRPSQATGPDQTTTSR